MAGVSRESGIYCLVVERPEGGPLFYIGQTKNFVKRRREHMNALRRGLHKNPPLQNAVDKYRNVRMEVLEVVEHERLTEREHYWWRTFTARYGADRVLNLMEPSENPMNDPEVRQRQVEAVRSLVKDPEWRRKFEEGHQRKVNNPSWRQRQAEVARNLVSNPKWVEANRAAIIARTAKYYVFRSPGGERIEVYNLTAFCRENGLSQPAMWEVSRGRRPHHRGWTRWDDGSDLTP